MFTALHVMAWYPSNADTGHFDRCRENKINFEEFGRRKSNFKVATNLGVKCN